MTDIARIRELLSEKEYPITGDSPLTRYALALRNAIGPLLDRMEAMEKENAHLRASVANNGGACIYCALPKDEWAKCKDGFPGCGRADDAMLCPNVGAALEAEEQLAALRTDLAYYQAKWENELSTVSKLERERDALRQANKDCVDHFEVLKVDYDTLRREVEK